MQDVIRRYLASPATRRDATLRAMLRRPAEAFTALMTFDGPYPEDCYPQDVFPDYLSPLLSELLRRVPVADLCCDRSRMSSGQRWTLVAAAIESRNPALADLILAGLSDRAIDVKLLVVEAIPRFAFLRKAAVRSPLQRLLRLESMSPYRRTVERALKSLDRRSTL